MRQWPIRSQGCHKAVASAHAPHPSSPFQNADRRTAMPAVPARRSRVRAAPLIHDQRKNGETLVCPCHLLRLFYTALNGARASVYARERVVKGKRVTGGGELGGC